MGAKIATCCYCGARTALSLIGTERHELACAQCGAPLREMKQMPTHSAAQERPKKSKSKAVKPRKIGKKKPRKSPYRRLFAEIVDVIEDVFD